MECYPIAKRHVWPEGICADTGSPIAVNSVLGFALGGMGAFRRVRAKSMAPAPPAAVSPSAQSSSTTPSAASSQAAPSAQTKLPAETTPAAHPATAQPAPKTLELTDFQQFVAQSLGYPLPIYGASLFNAPATFAPVDRIPVTSNYVIGPGDELLIRAWGQIDLDIHARVDRNGTIFIPKVGQLNVSGLRFDQLQGFLTSHIGRIYQNFDLTVTMGDLRSIDIFVVGQASQPGRYTVSSLSTLTNAIFASGGPLPSGSMRRIQLKRGAKVVTEFDLYDLLIKGDKSHDVLLQPEDVLYFPPVGPQVAVGGQVNTPAIYELKGETTLADVFDSGGRPDQHRLWRQSSCGRDSQSQFAPCRRRHARLRWSRASGERRRPGQRDITVATFRKCDHLAWQRCQLPAVIPGTKACASAT